jgi:hypothetical protein
MKKNFDTKAEALESLRLGIPKKVKEVKGISSTDGKPVAIEAIFKAITGAKGAADFRSILESILNTDEGSRGPTFYSNTWGYGVEFLIKSTKPAKSWNWDADRSMARPFASVAGKQVHMLDLNETISTSDWASMACSTNCNMLDELIYEYSVTVGDVGTAKRVAEKFNELNNGNGPIVSSERLADYEPFFAMVSGKKGAKKAKWVIETISNYMEAFKNSKEQSDRALNSKMMSEFRDIFRHSRHTVFSVLDKESNEGTTSSAIDDFDIIESNASARRNLFSVPSYLESKKMADLAKRDPQRLSKIVSRHLNSEHPNGVRRSQFLRMYRKISEHVKLDPMELNTKLQSYVLLEEIN